ncbi:MAG: hypothetical protein ACJAZ3_001397 [Sphingobacteriales bacterium]
MRFPHLAKRLINSMRIFIIVLFSLSPFILKGQTLSEYNTLDSTHFSTILDSIKSKFSTNKTIEFEHELALYTALSYYPSLKTTRIKFKKSKIKTTLNVRPTIGSTIFRSKENRKYIVRFNKHRKDSVINYLDIPFNARVGVLAHEFAHIADYNSRNFFQLFSRATDYSTKKTKAKFEKEIDSLTIKKGLGWQLHHWSHSL